MHGTTFGGGPLTCAVAKAFLDELKHSSLLQHAEKTGDYFVTQLKSLAKEHGCIVNVRGKGLMIAMELNSADLAKKTVLTLLERGVIINRTHETVLRFLPPYIIERQHVDSALTSLTTVEATAHAGKGAL
jgi:acetylornithine aminotransferase/acetylornithine/N-succinyldiaminopimelate aminotransferase